MRQKDARGNASRKGAHGTWRARALRDAMRETELHSLEPFALAYHGAVAVHRRARGARSQADSTHGRRDHKRGRHRERMKQAQDQATSHCDDERAQNLARKRGLLGNLLFPIRSR